MTQHVIVKPGDITSGDDGVRVRWPSAIMIGTTDYKRKYPIPMATSNARRPLNDIFVSISILRMLILIANRIPYRQNHRKLTIKINRLYSQIDVHLFPRRKIILKLSAFAGNYILVYNLDERYP